MNKLLKHWQQRNKVVDKNLVTFESGKKKIRFADSDVMGAGEPDDNRGQGCDMAGALSFAAGVYVHFATGESADYGKGYPYAELTDLPGEIAERLEAIAEKFADECKLMYSRLDSAAEQLGRAASKKK